MVLLHTEEYKSYELSAVFIFAIQINITMLCLDSEQIHIKKGVWEIFNLDDLCMKMRLPIKIVVLYQDAANKFTMIL